VKVLPLLLAAGCASVGVEQAAIVGGTADPGDPAVVLVEYDTYQRTPTTLLTDQHLCSGSLIAPTVVLTAGHCTDGAFVAKAPIFVESDHPSDRVYGLAYTHPGYDPLSFANDVGVIVLERPVCGRPAPLPFNQAPLDNSVVGLPLRLVGFGSLTPEDQTPSQKRSVVVTLLSLGAQTLTDVDPYRGPCRGDSGGPAFLTLGGVEAIAGVSSRGDAQCIEGIAQRVDTVADFVTPFLAASPSPIPYDCDPPSGCSTVQGASASRGVVLMLLLAWLLRRATRGRGGRTPSSCSEGSCG
jgi:secreted trypsin-like serine protease